MIDLIRKNQAVRDVAIVAFADRRTCVGLYAFVESDLPALEARLGSEIAAARGNDTGGNLDIFVAGVGTGGTITGVGGGCPSYGRGVARFAGEWNAPRPQPAS